VVDEREVSLEEWNEREAIYVNHSAYRWIRRRQKQEAATDNGVCSSSRILDLLQSFISSSTLWLKKIETPSVVCCTEDLTVILRLISIFTDAPLPLPQKRRTTTSPSINLHVVVRKFVDNDIHLYPPSLLPRGRQHGWDGWSRRNRRSCIPCHIQSDSVNAQNHRMTCSASITDTHTHTHTHGSLTHTYNKTMRT
jgi:hypothetical protein